MGMRADKLPHRWLRWSPPFELPLRENKRKYANIFVKTTLFYFVLLCSTLLRLHGPISSRATAAISAAISDRMASCVVSCRSRTRRW